MSNAVMVTGGSGFIGQNLVRHLAAEKKRTVVSLYYRRLPDALDSVYPVCSDMGSPELMLAPLRGVETVFHLAWEGGLAGPSDPLDCETTLASGKLPRNAQLLQNLIAAMERAGTKRLIFVSALGAAPRSASAFLREKYLSEFLVLNAKIPEKVVVRTAVVWGGQSEDRFLRSMMRVMKYPFYPLPRKAEGIAPVNVRDLVETLGRALSHPMKEGAALVELDGGERYKVDELFKIVSDRLVKKTRIPIGGFVGESLLPLVERESGAVGAQRIQHFLALGGGSNARTQTENPFDVVLPRAPESFKVAVAKA